MPTFCCRINFSVQTYASKEAGLLLLKLVLAGFKTKLQTLFVLGKATDKSRISEVDSKKFQWIKSTFPQNEKSKCCVCTLSFPESLSRKFYFMTKVRI
ncbi:hypothetical protein TNIN_305881 [Trichonephila inaurata madagascariensis]|uniref:Uncharacterized protein n=1 Tax=Trichonephila inaurata madagascariensis TaxID=2747483 RepID=A0A8X6YX66_9ARAC|nr:hypothetical protein TNIN_305881 [Trichonephila inaurata madagascariensis]